MDKTARRLAAAAFNEGHPQMAAAILQAEWRLVPGASASASNALMELQRLIAEDDPSEIDASPEGADHFLVDGDAVSVADLTLAELIEGAFWMTPDHEEQLRAALVALDDTPFDELRADRIRLLLADYLFDPAARHVAADRLRRIGELVRHEQRGIDDVFDG